MRTLELQLVDPDLDDIVVDRIDGLEVMSSVSRFDVQMNCHAEQAERAVVSLLHRTATLTLAHGGTPVRAFHGIITRASSEGMTNGRLRMRLRLRPRLWRLRLRRNSRIFQDLSAVDVIRLILAEHDVSVRLRLAGEHPLRAYCVQYRESDYALCRRLMAEEGIFYYLDHPLELGGPDGVTGLGGGEVVALGDTASFYPPIAGAPDLHVRAGAGASALEAEEAVHSLVLVRALNVDFARGGRGRVTC